MNWIKENKFLTGFIAVMVVGGGALTYLVLDAQGRYSTAVGSFEDQSRQLNALKSASPFPDQKNLEVFRGQAKELQGAITTLQTNLNANEIPLEPMTPQQFQDKLKEAVLRVTAKAKEKGVKLEEKFYLGFDYQNEPPKVEAAPLLGRELKAVELVVMELLNNQITALTKLERDLLPEEGDKSRPGQGAPGGRNNDRNREAGAKPLVTKHAIEIAFISDQNAFRTALNNLASSKTQFIIPRRIEIKNEKVTGPAKEVGTPISYNAPVPPPDSVPAAPAPAVPSPAVPAPALPVAAEPAPVAVAPVAAGQQLKYIVGEEKVEIAIRLEFVDFAELSSK